MPGPGETAPAHEHNGALCRRIKAHGMISLQASDHLRALGRAIGALGGQYNRFGQYYGIRNGDAHSWVEVWDATEGWVTFDPTPPAGEAPVVRTGIFAETDAAIEAVRMRWPIACRSLPMDPAGPGAARATRSCTRVRAGSPGRCSSGWCWRSGGPSARWACCHAGSGCS